MSEASDYIREEQRASATALAMTQLEFNALWQAPSGADSEPLVCNENMVPL